MNLVWEHCKLAARWDRTYLALGFPLLLGMFAWLVFGLHVASLEYLFLVSLMSPFSMMHRDVGARPLSFCLPGYRDLARATVLIDAVLSGLALAAAFVAIFRSDEWNRSLAGGAAFMGFIAGFMSVFPKASSHYGFLILWPAIKKVFSIRGGIGILIVLAAVIACPWLIWPVDVLACAWICVFAWYRLSNAYDVTQAHRTVIEEAMAKRAKAGSARMAPDWIHDLFLAQVRRHHPLGTWCYVWASLYRSLGPLLSYWKWILAGAFLLSLVLVRSVAEVTFVSMAFAATLVDLPVTSNMLLPGGRRERFLATVVAAIALSLLLVIVAAMAVCFSETIVTLLGLGARSLGTPLLSIWLACTLVPWVCAWRLRGCGRSRTGNEISTFLYEVVMLTFLPLVLFTCDWPAQARYLLFGTVGASGWVFFLAALQRVCTRGDLLAPKPLKGGRP